MYVAVQATHELSAKSSLIMLVVVLLSNGIVNKSVLFLLINICMYFSTSRKRSAESDQDSQSSGSMNSDSPRLVFAPLSFQVPSAFTSENSKFQAPVKLSVKT